MQARCQLLALPGEIRNQIWELILDEALFCDAIASCPWAFLPIMQTCKQIRREVLSIRYSEAVEMPLHCSNRERLSQSKQWLRLREADGVLARPPLLIYTVSMPFWLNIFSAERSMNFRPFYGVFLVHVKTTAAVHDACELCETCNNPEMKAILATSDQNVAGGLHLSSAGCIVHVCYTIERRGGLWSRIEQHAAMQDWLRDLLPEVEDVARCKGNAKSLEALLERINRFQKSCLFVSAVGAIATRLRQSAKFTRRHTEKEVWRWMGT